MTNDHGYMFKTLVSPDAETLRGAPESDLGSRDIRSKSDRPLEPYLKKMPASYLKKNGRDNPAHSQPAHWFLFYVVVIPIINEHVENFGDTTSMTFAIIIR